MYLFANIKFLVLATSASHHNYDNCTTHTTKCRYFIVIDDVWKEQDYNLIKTALPDNNNGSRIIATTRIAGVANLCCSNSGGQLYQMAPLGDIDSRRLFFKRIFHADDPCPAELEEVSTRILKKCGGLPLAIVTFASLLATKPCNKDEWQRLQDSIGSGSSPENDGNFKGMKDILLVIGIFHTT
jgi:disease resistance protein RPM1